MHFLKDPHTFLSLAAYYTLVLVYSFDCRPFGFANHSVGHLLYTVMTSGHIVSQISISEQWRAASLSLVLPPTLQIRQ